MTTTRSTLAGRLVPALLAAAAVEFLCPGGLLHGQQELLLRAGSSQDHQLLSGEAHVYRIEATDGEPRFLVVEQHGIDVEVEVQVEASLRSELPAESPFSTAGGREQILVVDSPFDRRGQESLLLEGSKEYRVVVSRREVGAPDGRYTIRTQQLSTASESSESWVAAARAMTRGAQSYRVGTRESWLQALAHYQQAADHWQALAAAEERALARFAQGVLFRILDESRDGLSAALEARDMFRLGAKPYLESYASNEIGLGHWYLGDLESARRAFRRSVSIARGLADDFAVAAALSNVCLMELSSGDLEAGHACYESALPVIERAEAVQIESAARTNLGRLTETLGEPEKARAHYARALDILSVTGDRRGQARTLNNLGVLLSGMGELDGAMARYGEALEIFESLGERRWQARTLSNIGYVDRAVGEPRRAVVSFGRALDLFEQAEDQRGQATSYDNLGLAERELGEPREALELHHRALALRRQMGDRRGEAVTLRRLGEVQWELGDVSSALGHLDQAVALAAELRDDSNESLGRLRLGEIHLSRRQIDAARGELQKALMLATGAGQRLTEAELRYHLARVERASGKGREALELVASAIEGLEGLRSRFESPQLRTSYSSLLRRSYELQVELHMEAHRLDPEAGQHLRALEVAERARAKTFLELLQEAEVDLREGVDPRLWQQRESAGHRLNAKTERLKDPRLDERVRELLAGEQLAALQKLDALDAEIRRKSPAYGAIVRPRSLAVSEMQALVDERTTLAVYFLAEERSYLWRVRKDSLEVFELPARKRIEAAAKNLHRKWSELDVASRGRDHQMASEMAKWLRLPSLLGSERLAVIADGALHVVPFAALPVAGAAEGNPGGRPAPLLSSTEVVFLPSTSVLAFHRQRQARPLSNPTVAVLADPRFGPDLPSLPASREEAESIVAALPSDSTFLALGLDANLELLESGELEGFDIVHLATHGVIDTQNPALSGLVLSQVDERGRPRRSHLRLHDVFGLNLDNELVVLSGCRTAMGPVVRGEGLIGLVRAFMYAGSRRVVASLWPVEDRATAVLMANFYQAIGDGSHSPSQALAAAQRSLFKQRRYRDPYYWAGFVLVGDWR